jgi:hypothetical protein
MKALLRCERGAIMVMALFMAIFATGCLYYIAGIAEAIAQREVMQDAADAAAFSAAVLHARGMNVIALINMTMAALLAVLVALRLIEVVSYIGVGIATGLAFVTGGGSLIAVPPFTATGLLAMEAYEVAQPVVHATLRALHFAARGVRIAIPWVAQAQTVGSIAKRYEPYASFAFEVPGTLTLPTRDGTFDDLCTKSGEYAGDLANIGLARIPTDGFGVGGLVAELVDGGSSYFCGTEGAVAPSTPSRREVWHPLLPKNQQCEEMAERARRDRQAPATDHARICAEGQREAAAADAAIDRFTGECIADCEIDGLYELRAARALEACAPRRAGERPLNKFWWQERRFKRRYLWEDERWVLDTLVVPGSDHTVSVKGAWWRPCGTPSASVSDEWNTEQWHGSELVPICDNIEPPTEPPLYGGNVLELEHTQVLRFFQCREVFKERHELGDEAGALGADDKNGEMAPQLIAEGAQLGEDPFQIRAVVIGEPPSTSPAPMLGQLRSEEAKSNDDETAVWAIAKQVSRVSVAQAEFYFADAGASPDSYLWAMHWTARLRPFRLPAQEPAQRRAEDVADAAASIVGEALGTFDQACEVAQAATGAVSETGGWSCNDLDLESIADLITH